MQMYSSFGASLLLLFIPSAHLKRVLELLHDLAEHPNGNDSERSFISSRSPPEKAFTSLSFFAVRRSGRTNSRTYGKLWRCGEQHSFVFETRQHKYRFSAPFPVKEQ
jgi:hypothetical protein